MTEIEIILPKIFFVVWTPNEESDSAFDAQNPVFFADYDSATRFIEEEEADGGDRYGQYHGPYAVPQYSDLVAMEHRGLAGQSVV